MERVNVMAIKMNRYSSPLHLLNIHLHFLEEWLCLKRVKVFLTGEKVNPVVSTHDIFFC